MLMSCTIETRFPILSKATAFPASVCVYLVASNPYLFQSLQELFVFEVRECTHT